MFDISELRIEVQQLRQINEERDAQATDYNNRLTESNLLATQLQNQLEATKHDAKIEKDTLSRELATLRTSLNSAETKAGELKNLLDSEKASHESTKRTLEERQAELGTQQERIEALQAQHEVFKVE